MLFLNQLADPMAIYSPEKLKDAVRIYHIIFRFMCPHKTCIAVDSHNSSDR